MDSFTKQQLLDEFDAWERHMLAHAETEGLTQKDVAMLRGQIVACYRIRFDDDPAKLRAVVETMNDADTLLHWVELCVTAPARDIAAALASAAPSP